jgi:hypothetical protein
MLKYASCTHLGIARMFPPLTQLSIAGTKRKNDGTYYATESFFLAPKTKCLYAVSNNTTDIFFLDIRSKYSNIDSTLKIEQQMDTSWAEVVKQKLKRKVLRHPDFKFNEDRPEPFTIIRVNTNCEPLKLSDIDDTVFKTNVPENPVLVETLEKSMQLLKGDDDDDHDDDDDDEKKTNCDSNDAILLNKRIISRVVNEMHVTCFGQNNNELFIYIRDCEGARISNVSAYFQAFIKHKQILKTFAQDKQMVTALKLLIDSASPYRSDYEKAVETLPYFCTKLKDYEQSLSLPDNIIIYRGLEKRRKKSQSKKESHCDFYSYTTSPLVAYRFQYDKNGDTTYETTTVGDLKKELENNYEDHSCIPLWLSEKCAPMPEWIARGVLNIATRDVSVYSKNMEFMSTDGIGEYEILFVMVKSTSVAVGKTRDVVHPIPQNLPCPNELKYKRGEYLNLQSDERVQGASSTFIRERHPKIDLEEKEEWSKDDLVSLLQNTGQLSLQKQVIDELYRASEKMTTDYRHTSGEAYREVFSNDSQSQYYLQTVEEKTTLIHIILSGRFWSLKESNISIDNRTHAYTTGFVWCNTSPNWTWKESHEQKPLIRCRIDIPKGTQVVVDRSPVSQELCQFDADCTSLFPDVLLPPGEFEIDSVVYYRSTDKQGDPIREEDNSKHIVYVQPNDSNLRAVTALNDNEYAAKMLSFCSEFIDVALKVTKMMRLSAPDTLVVS